MEVLFWISLFIVFYTYIGYGMLLFLLVKCRQAIKGKRRIDENISQLPTLTLIVAAFNEEDFIEAKIENSLALNYPSEKLEYIFVTDGSSDQTPQIISRYPKINLLHAAERRGKINAMHRAMNEVKTEVVVFTDANTILNKDALRLIARHYADKKVGAVSGEKRVMVSKVSDATAGEGFYWKYESTLKKWDAELYSVIGAAGELFSIRTHLYKPVQTDTILDDFMVSLAVVDKGYRIAYEPEAYAQEEPSANTKEELKRKIRIAAGGMQSIKRLPHLFNPFRHPVLSFQFISHRVLRWTITPFLMILAYCFNLALAYQYGQSIYTALLFLQTAFYAAAFVGWQLEARSIRIKLLFVPYYFCFMNYAVLAGIKRFAANKQSASWEKAGRKIAKEPVSV
jgi:cellulose synthase/poly-beta-1,6-N-acetylglucosamine synthase-like glycosyltransferase